MATVLPTPEPPPGDALPESVWRAPLVPAALAVTAGIVLDRYTPVPILVSLLVTFVALLAWLLARAGSESGLPLVYLGLAAAGVGCAYHHYQRDVYPADDIGNAAPETPWPVRLRGRLDAEPRRNPLVAGDPLRSRDRQETTATLLRVTHLHRPEGWVEVSGKVRLVVTGSLPGLHVGDEVEVVGRMARIAGPANPGEFDVADYWRDQGVRAQVVVSKTPAGLTRLQRRWPATFAGWLAVVRGWGQDVLARTLPESTRNVAMALLLGEGAPMSSSDWDKYVRTGVIHVLAISGQHLVVLALFLWWGLRLAGVRQRRGAVLVAAVLVGYALLTGARPPALRSAVMVLAACVGLVLRRRTLPANLFALAWLAVAALNPTDLFDQGCQLSFLAVAVLYWGARRMLSREEDPLDAVIDAARPAWLRELRWLGRALWEGYLVTALVWVAVTPLAAYRTHVIPPAGLLLGPPLTLLTSVALLAGFLLLAVGGISPTLASPLGWVVHQSLLGCERLVDLGNEWCGPVYVPDVGEWWVWVFYVALLAALTQLPLVVRWRWVVVAGLGWLCVGLLAGAARLPEDELRCTFLAVGHGGCIVLETPGGQTLLYDAGAMAGPDVTRRQIAPFLWHRGVRRVDEVFLSHADLDHFNGLVALLDRFNVGQVTWTPTFPDKPTRGVRYILDELARRKVPVRVVKAGDRLTAGGVEMEVLHPPARGPEGTENARSLVLLVRHAGHSILLTGDLEAPGLEMVLGSPKRRADVLMAPHHGSHRLDIGGLTKWCRPRLVVACQGPPQGRPKAPALYSRRGATFWSTWEQGAVTVRSHASGVVAETFLTRQRVVLRTEAPEAEE